MAATHARSLPYTGGQGFPPKATGVLEVAGL